MLIAVAATRVLLAMMFMVSGCAKLVDRPGTRRTITGFGAPAGIAGALAVAVPCAELAVAGGLLAAASARWAVVGALALVAVFTAAVGVNLAHGRRPPCNCFGQLHPTPISARTLVRNGALLAVASFALVAGWRDPGPSGAAWVGLLSSAEWLAVCAGGVVLALGGGLVWFVVNLAAQQGRILLRLEAVEAVLRESGVLPSLSSDDGRDAGLPVGSTAPEFRLPGTAGETLTLKDLRAPGHPVLLLFTDPSCGPCSALMPEIARWQRDHADRLTIGVISAGDAAAIRSRTAEHGAGPVLLDGDSAVATSYRCSGTPSAVLVAADGRIASPTVGGAPAIRTLAAQAASEASTVPLTPLAVHASNDHHNGHRHSSPNAAAPAIGDPAPPLALPDLDGRPVELAGFAGERIVVLFWDPRCGFCQRMLDELKAWERTPPRAAPRLLVVSSGSVDANRTMDLRSLVLLDGKGGAMRAFGADGTPMAVLVDEGGRIASPLAAGAAEVMALARG